MGRFLSFCQLFLYKKPTLFEFSSNVGLVLSRKTFLFFHDKNQYIVSNLIVEAQNAMGRKECSPSGDFSTAPKTSRM